MDKLIVILNEYSFRKDNDVIWFNELIKNIYLNFNVIYTNYEQYDDEYFIKTYNKIPDFIIGFEIFIFPNNKSKKILITEDLHLRPLDVYLRLFDKVDIILPKFNIINNLFLNKFKHKIIEFPQYCSKLFLTDKINFNSINKIVMYGNMNYEQYYLRQKWHNLMLNNYNHIYLYIYDNSVNTSNQIKKYSFGLTCGYMPKSFIDYGENNGYIVSKFFEIMGSGLLLLADTTNLKNELNNYGFINMNNYNDVDFNNINEIINYIYDDKNTNEIIKKRHLIENRINTLNLIFNNDLNTI